MISICAEDERPQLPLCPEPHERDGRQDQPGQARPHSRYGTASRPGCGVVAGDPLADIERDDDGDGWDNGDEDAFWLIVFAAAAGVASSPADGLAPVSESGQCSVCSGRFDDWNGGVCDACRAVGR